MRLQLFLTTFVALFLGAVAQSALSDRLLAVLKPFNQNDATVKRISTTITQNKAAVDALGAEIRTRGACVALKYVLADQYFDAQTQTAAYNTLRDKNWSSNCDLPAACIITPSQNVQVSVALKIIDVAGTKFSVRSGGHNQAVRAASVGAEGVLIDVKNFNALQISADRASVRVGTGNVWGTVQAYLDPMGLSAVSGRYGSVGTGGLALLGGYPIISSFTGLSADNILSAEIVLGDSRVVTASATQNSDLLKALKGGGNNFGIVTSFQLKTQRLRNIWYRTVAYAATTPAAVRQVMQALVDTQLNMERDNKAGLQAIAVPGAILVNFVYAEHTSNPAAFAPFAAVPVAQERQPATNGTLLAQSQTQPPQDYAAIRGTATTTTKLDVQLYVDIYNKFVQVGQRIAPPTQEAYRITICPVTSQTIRYGQAQNGGNIMGQTAVAQTWWQYSAEWTTPADDAKYQGGLNEVNAFSADQSNARGMGLRYLFGNAISKDQNLIGSYGAANVAFAKSVSQKYDPGQVFQRLLAGGWLVSKS